MVQSDLEGPWVKADHAYDVTSRAIRGGERLFTVLSSYDDYRFFVERAPGYEAGDTLVLIAPFLVAFGADDAFLRSVARSPENTALISGAREAVRYLQHIEDFFLISTSYEQYVEFAASLLGVPAENLFCTAFPIDQLAADVEEGDKEMVKRWARRIQRMPVIKLSEGGKLCRGCARAKSQIDNFYWEILPKTSFSRILEVVRPLGGTRKLQALEEALKREGRTLSSAAVVGDSITDSVMLEKVKEAGGLALSFNGNRYAIHSANVAIVSNNCFVTAAVIEAYRRCGLKSLRELSETSASHGFDSSVFSGCVSDDMVRQAEEGLRGERDRGAIFWIDEDNLDHVIQVSEAFRKKVRGTAIGQLG